MALTEKTVVDLVEVVGDHTIQVRTATIIEKDGIEISRGYSRHVLEPGADLTNQDSKVQAVANALWTEAVIQDFQTKLNQDKIA